MYEAKYSVIIQTAKAFYKAGEKVQFRVLVVDENTKPYEFERMRVAVTDANRQVIYRLKNANLTNGAFEGSVLLSEEPVLGEWGIHVKIDNSSNSTIKNFEVKDYQLPRFWAVLKTNPTAFLSDGMIKVTVHGRYTHGWKIRFVKGKATIKAQVFFHNLNNTPVHEFKRTVLSEGLTHLQFDLEEDLKIDLNETKKTFVSLSLTFEEELTGKNMTKEQLVTLERQKSTEMISIDRKPNFKPGFLIK